MTTKKEKFNKKFLQKAYKSKVKKADLRETLNGNPATSLDQTCSPPVPVHPVPSKLQLRWHRAEMAMFLHLGINTFTDREWGDGKEDPNIFNPTNLDCRQWTRVARETGFKLMILTTKHHDGFCLWPSKFTDHSVKSSMNWRDGEGDVVHDFTDACREEGILAGVYLSPWDRHEKAYGDSPRYNEYFCNQLTELLTNYGQIAEVWFDGACGEGPNGKRQIYDWISYWKHVRKLQPNALISIVGPDIRWVGNESGVARENESSIITLTESPSEHAKNLRTFSRKDCIWYPAECDTSIRRRWFWHKDDKVKSLEMLLDIYFASVGRNSVLLLNIPPNDKGLLAETDIKQLREFKAALDEIFQTDFAKGAKVAASNVRGNAKQFGPKQVLDGNLDSYWATDDDKTTGWIELDLGQPKIFNVIRVQEAIILGERIEAWHVEALVCGQWKMIVSGTMIGQKQLRRLPAYRVQHVRLVIDKAKACPAIAEFGLHFYPFRNIREPKFAGMVMPI